MWVAKGHWVWIVQKQDGNNVLEIGVPMTSLLIHRHGEICVAAAPRLIIALLISHLRGRSPHIVQQTNAKRPEQRTVLSHNLKDSDMKKVLWCLTYRASKCHRPKQVPISNNSGPLQGSDIQNWWAPVPRVCPHLASPRPLGNLSGPEVSPWEPSSI